MVHVSDLWLSVTVLAMVVVVIVRWSLSLSVRSLIDSRSWVFRHHIIKFPQRIVSRGMHDQNHRTTPDPERKGKKKERERDGTGSQSSCAAWRVVLPVGMFRDRGWF